MPYDQFSEPKPETAAPAPPEYRSYTSAEVLAIVQGPPTRDFSMVESQSVEAAKLLADVNVHSIQAQMKQSLKALEDLEMLDTLETISQEKYNLSVHRDPPGSGLFTLGELTPQAMTAPVGKVFHLEGTHRYDPQSGEWRVEPCDPVIQWATPDMQTYTGLPPQSHGRLELRSGGLPVPGVLKTVVTMCSGTWEINIEGRALGSSTAGLRNLEAPVELVDTSVEPHVVYISGECAIKQMTYEADHSTGDVKWYASGSLRPRS